jgi:hypothetical protein
MMDFLTAQGDINYDSPFTVDLGYNNLSEGINVIPNILKAPGQFSELVTRMSIMNRWIKKGEAKWKKEGHNPSIQERADLEREAVFQARNYLDFNEGGKITKIGESALPYLNASAQVARGHVRSFRRDKGLYAIKLAQMGAIGSAFVFLNMKGWELILKSIGADDGEETAKEMAEYYKNDVSDVEKSRKFILMLPWSYDNRVTGKKEYVYLRIPKDKFFSPFIGFMEDMMMAGIEGTVPKIWNDKRNMEVIETLTSVYNPDMRPPSYAAIQNYKQNYDQYRQQQIWRKDGDDVNALPGPPEYTPGKTDPIWIELGERWNKSPERLKNSYEQLFTGNNVFGDLGLNLAELALVREEYKNLKKLSEKEPKEFWKDRPFLRRVLGNTSEYTKTQIATKLEKENKKRIGYYKRDIDAILLEFKDPKIAMEKSVDYAKNLANTDTLDAVAVHSYAARKIAKSLKGSGDVAVIAHKDYDTRAQFIAGYFQKTEGNRKKFDDFIASSILYGGIFDEANKTAIRIKQIDDKENLGLVEYLKANSKKFADIAKEKSEKK